jgi:hypothetical protein
MPAMLCSRHRPAIAVSPSALRTGWLAERVCADPLWTRADVFLVDTLFGGEAACPNEASALCREALRPAQLHFAVADERDAVRAAAAYEQELRAHFNLKAGELPRFDLVVCAARDARPVADEYSRIAVARYSAEARRSYVTLTEPVLRLAAQHLRV